MPALVDTRPPGVNLLLRPGTTITLTLAWPAGTLAGRSFTSTLNGQALTVTIVGDTMMIGASDTVTDDLTIGVGYEWLLLESIGGTPEPIIIGTWIASKVPSAVSATTVQVTQGAVQIDITLSTGGGADLSALTRSLLAYARWDPDAGTAGEVVWSGTAAPDSRAWTNVYVTAPSDPYTLPGVVNGRDVDGDIWDSTGF